MISIEILNHRRKLHRIAQAFQKNMLSQNLTLTSLNPFIKDLAYDLPSDPTFAGNLCYPIQLFMIKFAEYGYTSLSLSRISILFERDTPLFFLVIILIEIHFIQLFLIILIFLPYQIIVEKFNLNFEFPKP